MSEHQSPYDTQRRCSVCGNILADVVCPYCMTDADLDILDEWNEGIHEDDQPHYCERGHEMQAVRPGKWQCVVCEEIDAELAELRQHAPTIKKLLEQEIGGVSYLFGYNELEPALVWIEGFVK